MAWQKFPPLPASGNGRARLKVCIASFDFVGPIRNGGVGTAFTSLAEALAAGGHEVTLLYLSGRHCESDRSLDYWIEYYAKKNINLVPLPDQNGPRLDTQWHMGKSYEAYQWLRARCFDVVHFSEWRAPGYYSIVAKRQGLAFETTTFCVHTHGPTLWSLFSNGEYLTQVEELELDFMERESVHRADLVVSPSQYLLKWMQEQRWSLPGATYVQQYVRPEIASKPRACRRDLTQKITELVFFGRVEIRKGLVLFCDALDRLKDDASARDIEITFLGKLTKINSREGIEYLEERAAGWPWKWRVMADQDQLGAMEYLGQTGRLAVIPSLVDNLPNTVLECLGAAVPFVASTTGGIPEMIAAEDSEMVLFPLDSSVLARKLRTAVLDGIRAARFAVEPELNRSAWLQWHANLRGSLRAELEFCSQGKERPLVSICISHFNRPGYLKQAIASIEAQDYQNFEVVLVDDASSRREAIDYINTLEGVFSRRGWQLIRNRDELFVGAARNIAARSARGEYLKFMDDDNIAKSHELSTFVSVARRTGAAIVSCALDFFGTEHAPEPGAQPDSRFLFLGSAIAAGALRNYFGDTNSLFRREVFLALGGFHEIRRVGNEDWKLIGDAILRGYHLEAIPEALVWYRRTRSGENASAMNNFQAGHMANISPYLDAVPPSLRNLLLYAQGVTIARQQSPASEAAAERYQELTVRWRSKLEAGLAVGRFNPRLGADLMLQGVRSIENCRHPRVMLEALLEIAAHLMRLDAARAKVLLGFAIQVAQKFCRHAELAHARGMLEKLGGTVTAPASPVQHAVGTTA